jgi:L-asparaginase/beta-aspartyl-peptidase (threonine type)
MAASNSTGGAVPMMLGRVGDSPLPGAGFWAGPEGAVGTTGIGEDIVRRLAAREISLRLERGMTSREALDQVVAAFPEELSFGAAVLSPRDHGVGANRKMAQAVAVP